jgi:type I restriction enzyme S subunit
MKWPRRKFSDLYLVPSRNGLTRPSRVRGEGYKMVNMGELFANDRIGPIPMERVRMNDRELEQSTLAEGDLLFARQSLVLEGAGKCSYVAATSEPTTFESHLIRVRLDKAKADPLFYYYLFASPYSGISTIVQQCAQAGIRGSELSNLAVLYPPLEAQRGIANVLAAYDDLMENNRRRMTLLEETARLLYVEWFVGLRYPGHEHARVINGMPDGWRKMPALDAMHVMSGGTPKTTNPDYWDGDIPFFTPKDSVDACYVLDTEKHLTEMGLRQCNSRLYSKNTTFITARGTVGNVNLAQRPMAMNQSCYALAGRDGISDTFLFCSMREAIRHFRQHASGAVFDAIIVDTFKLIPFLWPDSKLVALFDETVAPMFKQIETLLLQNRMLHAARDLLLTRLMTGEIAV